MAERTLNQLCRSSDSDVCAFAKELLAAYEARYKGGSPAEAAEDLWESTVDAWLARYGDEDVRKAEKRAIQQLRVILQATRRDD